MERVHTVKIDRVDPQPEVYLYQGDAVYRSSSTKHPLSPRWNATYSSIIALDCAYHFNSRGLFLQQAYSSLQVGGTIALTDIVAGSSLRNRLLMRLIYGVLSVPMCNVLNKDQYLSELRAIGYGNLVVDDVTELVFPGFRNFLRSRGGVWNILERLGIGALADSDVRYIVVSAQKVERDAKRI